MNTQSHRRSLVALAAAVVTAAVLLSAASAMAQPAGDRGPWDRLNLTEEQREKVRDIVKEHRDASRAELH
ncbi:MAG: hypothetical protein PVI01_18920, partial [Gemmatimonadales bacterium]